MRVRYYDCIFEGSFSSVAIDAKRIAEIAMKCKCVSVILVHNHPSGIALPSVSDNNSTYQIALLLQQLGIELVDHLVFGGRDYVSYRQSRQLAQFVLAEGGEVYAAKDRYV